MMSSKKAKNRNKQRPDDDKNTASTAEDTNLESQIERFDQELSWCIEQLQLGLERQNPDSRQGTEAMKVLRILQSSKAPMIKKRQAMRNTFGDYRRKMREQELKSAAAAKRMKLTTASTTSCSKSQFYRKSASSSSRSQNSASSSKINTEVQVNTSNSASTEGLSNTFKFHFNLSEENRDDAASRVTKQQDSTNVGSEACTDTSVTVDSQEPCVLPDSGTGHDCSENSFGIEAVRMQNLSYKMTKSDNSFRFNFSSPDS